jgi:orotidine-5'-phosphate decarboxylase
VIARAESTGKGLFVLTATSNPEAAATQRAERADGRTVAAGLVAEIRERASQSLGVVIGGTVDPAGFGIAPGDLAGIPVLSPGFGVQGARLGDVETLFGAAAAHTLPSVSRSILGEGPDGLVAAIVSAKEELGE